MNLKHKLTLALLAAAGLLAVADAAQVVRQPNRVDIISRAPKAVRGAGR